MNEMAVREVPVTAVVRHDEVYRVEYEGKLYLAMPETDAGLIGPDHCGYAWGKVSRSWWSGEMTVSVSESCCRYCTEVRDAWERVAGAWNAAAEFGGDPVAAARKAAERAGVSVCGIFDGRDADFAAELDTAATGGPLRYLVVTPHGDAMVDARVWCAYTNNNLWLVGAGEISDDVEYPWELDDHMMTDGWKNMDDEGFSTPTARELVERL